MFTTISDVERAKEAAQRELRTILDAIATERGLSAALSAAGALRSAIAMGHLAGTTFYEPGGCACAVGHIALALGWDGNMNRLTLPGWSTEHHLSPIEVWVWNVDEGETPDDSPVLASLARWIDAWITEQRQLGSEQ